MRDFLYILPHIDLNQASVCSILVKLFIILNIRPIHLTRPENIFKNGSDIVCWWGVPAQTFL